MWQLTSNMMFYMLVLSFSSSDPKEKRELKYILVNVEYLARYVETSANILPHSCAFGTWLWLLMQCFKNKCNTKAFLGKSKLLSFNNSLYHLKQNQLTTAKLLQNAFNKPFTVLRKVKIISLLENCCLYKKATVYCTINNSFHSVCHHLSTKHCNIIRTKEQRL